MRVPLPFGYSLSLASRPGVRALAISKRAAALSPANGGWRVVFDTYAGQWQQDAEIDVDSVLTFAAVFACVRLITTDIGKLRIRLVELDRATGVWRETESPAFSPVLRKPNHYQTRIKFVEQWLTSKLVTGRTYVLKVRDGRGVVRELRVLDPNLVQPLVSDEGNVYYRVTPSQLSGLPSEVVVPAREIIHDVHVTPDHPLLGVSPIGACGLAASQGLKIQNNSRKFFANQSRAGFVLSAPGAINDETAARLKASWEANFGGENYGRTAVLGDGLEPKSFTVTADDSQLIEQLGWTGEDVCRAFGVPAYKVGIGAMPAFNNVEALDQAYYSQTLQELIECIELLLDEGLELPGDYGTEFDLEGLLRMDSKTRAEVDKSDISAGILAPNEARAKRGLDPVEGGESPYLQQQNYSLAALAKRDAREDPFATSGGATSSGGAADGGDAADAGGDPSAAMADGEGALRALVAELETA